MNTRFQDKDAPARLTSDPGEISVELVSSSDEGRMAYIAVIAGQLAKMATAAGALGCATLLASAAREATVAREKLVKS